MRDEVWGSPQEAVKAQGVFDEFKVQIENIKPDDRVILIQPKETILAHTNEFIGGKKNITTMMKSRSSMGRSFINACKCAGWGDIGYINRWTLEITNFSNSYAIPLVVGRRIAQIVFLYTGETSRSYANEGKYQTNTDLETLKLNWSPEMMLPRLDRDKDIKS